MKKILILFSIFAALSIAQTAHTKSKVEKKISVAEHNNITMSLYKEIRAMKKKGLLFNNCGIGACAAPELHAWVKKWRKHRDVGCYDGFPGLTTSLGEKVIVSDLYDIAVGAYEDLGVATMYKFESALLCYENPKICK